jgi:hypothetical protein
MTSAAWRWQRPAPGRRSRPLRPVGALQASITWGLRPAPLRRWRSAEQGGLQLRDGGHALGGEHAAALQLPVLVLLQQHRPHQAGDGGVVGEDADDTVRRLISSLTRSSRLVLQTLRQWCCGKWRNASTSSRASCMSSAALGKRSASEAARSSQRLRSRSALLGEHAAQGGGDHALVSLGNPLHEITM